MGIHYRADGSSYIEIKTYDFHCDIGNHYVRGNAIGPVNCSICHRVGCFADVRHYGCCNGCWAGLSDEQKQTQKKAYLKGMGQSFGLIIFGMILVFLIPLIIWLTTRNIDLLLASIFIGLFLFLFFICKLINYSRKKSLGPAYKSIGQELKESFQNRPKMDNKSKKILILVLGFFIVMILVIVIIAAVIMADFNARWD